jgi:hypothetical protein
MIKRLFKLIGGRPRNGESFEEAIIIHAMSSADGVPKEYEWVERRFGRRGRDWELRYQAVMEHQERWYDLLAIRLAGGSEKDIYFDITSFFPRSHSSGGRVDAESHIQSEEDLEEVMVIHTTGGDRIAKQYTALFVPRSHSSGGKVDAESHIQSEEDLEEVMVIHATGGDRIAKQYAALETRFGRRDRDWKVLSESTVVHGVRVYHVIEIQLADGSVKNIHFKVKSL